MEMWKHKFEVKKNKWVYVPSEEMVTFGKRLHKNILKKWKAPVYYYHMRDGGHVCAAKMHLRNNHFSLIDIRHFFDSTSQSRVTRELKTIFPYEMARKIAKLSTVRIPSANAKKFSIPYGYPQSPILATLCLCNSYAGRVLDEIYRGGFVTVSIYMDDIILSSDSLSNLEHSFHLVCEGLKKSRYEINNIKTQPPSDAVKVFNLEVSNNRFVVTSSRMVQFIKDYSQADNQYVRKGIATYVHTVNPYQSNLHFPK